MTPRRIDHLDLRPPLPASEGEILVLTEQVCQQYGAAYLAGDLAECRAIRELWSIRPEVAQAVDELARALVDEPDLTRLAYGPSRNPYT